MTIGLDKNQQRLVWALLEIEECVFLHEEEFLSDFGNEYTGEIINFFGGSKFCVIEIMTAEGNALKWERLDTKDVLKWVDVKNE